MILRQGNVGPVVRGTQSGDLLVYDATTGEWFPSTGARAGRVVPVTKDLGTLAPAGTTVTFTVPGVAAGDSVFPNPSVLLSDSIALIQFHVSGPDAVDVVFYNLTGAPIVVGNQTLLFTVFKA